MSKICVYLCAFSLVVSSIVRADEVPVQPAPPEQKMITRQQYVTGGFLGTVVGFGLGHLAQSRTDTEKQDFFMLSELGVIGATMVLSISANGKECTQGGSKEQDCINDRSRSTSHVLTLGVLAFVGLRVFEIYDLWSYSNVEPLPPKVPKAALYIHPQSSDQVATSLVINF